MSLTENTSRSRSALSMRKNVIILSYNFFNHACNVRPANALAGRRWCADSLDPMLCLQEVATLHVSAQNLKMLTSEILSSANEWHVQPHWTSLSVALRHT